MIKLLIPKHRNPGSQLEVDHIYYNYFPISAVCSEV